MTETFEGPNWTMTFDGQSQFVLSYQSLTKQVRKTFAATDVISYRRNGRTAHLLLRPDDKENFEFGPTQADASRVDQLLTWAESIPKPSGGKLSTKERVAELREVRANAQAISLESYTVNYRGGHPDIPTAKAGGIQMSITPETFLFSPGVGSQKYWKQLEIPYSHVQSLEVAERIVGTGQAILGGLNSRQLNQANNLHLTLSHGQWRRSYAPFRDDQRHIGHGSSQEVPRTLRSTARARRFGQVWAGRVGARDHLAHIDGGRPSRSAQGAAGRGCHRPGGLRCEEGRTSSRALITLVF